MSRVLSWVSEKWKQDNLLNNGFPFPVDAGVSPKVDASTIKTPWVFRPDVNNGFPYIVTSAFIEPLPFDIFIGEREVSEIYIGAILIYSKSKSQTKIHVVE